MTNWRKLARCEGMDLKIFFPEKGSRAAYAEARRICEECPVVDECLESAIALEVGTNYLFGMYGGKNPKERERLRRARNKVAA